MDRAAIPNGSVRRRTVVITGANAGLGYACATALLRSPAVPGWHVILACRDASRADAAVEQLIAGSANAGHVEALALGSRHQRKIGVGRDTHPPIVLSRDTARRRDQHTISHSTEDAKRPAPFPRSGVSGHPGAVQS